MIDWAVDEQWRAFIEARREAERESIIASENLKPEETRLFVDHAFRDGSVANTGTAVMKILPPASRFSAGGGYGEKKARVIDRLSTFFDRFFGLSAGVSE